MLRIKGVALLETIYALSIISVSIVIGISVFNSILNKKSILKQFEIHQQVNTALQSKNKHSNIENITIKDYERDELKGLMLNELIYKDYNTTLDYKYIDKKD